MSASTSWTGYDTSLRHKNILNYATNYQKTIQKIIPKDHQKLFHFLNTLQKPQYPGY